MHYYHIFFTPLYIYVATTIFFSFSRRGSGFYSKLTLNGSVVYGVFTNNHVLSSLCESERANATFFYEGTNSGVKVKLRPEVIFRTNKVGLKQQSCFALQTAAKFDDERAMEYLKLLC